MNKRGVAVIVAAYVGMLTALVATVIGLGRLWPSPPAGAGTLVPCAEEDGSGDGQAYPCVWDARTRGNGQYTGYPVDHLLPRHVPGTRGYDGRVRGRGRVDRTLNSPHGPASLAVVPEP